MFKTEAQYKEAAKKCINECRQGTQNHQCVSLRSFLGDKLAVMQWEENGQRQRGYVDFTEKEPRLYADELTLIAYLESKRKISIPQEILKIVNNISIPLSILFSVVYCVFAYSQAKTGKIPEKFEAIMMIIIGYVFANVGNKLANKEKDTK